MGRVTKVPLSHAFCNGKRHVAHAMRLQTEITAKLVKETHGYSETQLNRFQAQWSCSLIQTSHLTELTDACRLGMYRCSETPENDNK